MSKYKIIRDGEWYYPGRRGMVKCCDCGLVHVTEYKHNNGNIMCRVFRNNRATAQVRRWMDPRKEK